MWLRLNNKKTNKFINTKKHTILNFQYNMTRDMYFENVRRISYIQNLQMVSKFREPVRPEPKR